MARRTTRSRTTRSSAPAKPRAGRVFIGTSGYDYPHWRGKFYPSDLPRRQWLSHASRLFNSIELNGTFYSLKSPALFRRWAAEVPVRGFVFAIKGSRFITHNLKLRRAEQALANFYASGVLALGQRTGPFLWQLPDGYRFEAPRIEGFLKLLPRDSQQATELARGHDKRLTRGALTTAQGRVRYRHAFEVRHPSYSAPEFYELLRRYRCAFVFADMPGTSYAEELTADWVYVRFHGLRERYASGYTGEELEKWAQRIAAWARPTQDKGRDVYVYFSNDAKAHAPHDAQSLRDRVRRLLGWGPGWGA